MFRDDQLIEKMIDIFIDTGKTDFHDYAIGIIQYKIERILKKWTITL